MCIRDSLYIEQTEALVAIDVNSGKFTSAGDAEQTAYRTNLEAIPEIVRQLRLRDLGGIICNDLIDMLSASHRADIENELNNRPRRVLDDCSPTALFDALLPSPPHTALQR